MKLTLLALAAGLSIASASQGYAQALSQACGPRDDVIKSIEDKYKEVRAGLGLAGDGTVVELYVSEQGSWTMLVTRPTGMTCMVGAGQNWEIVEPNYVAARGAKL